MSQYELFTKWIDYNHDSSDKTLELKNLALINMKSRDISCIRSKNQILLSVGNSWKEFELVSK